MLGYVVYEIEGCEISDNIKYTKKFKDEVQLFGELYTYFIDKNSCIVLKGKEEIEILGLFKYIQSKGLKAYNKEWDTNDFIESN